MVRPSAAARGAGAFLALAAALAALSSGACSRRGEGALLVSAASSIVPALEELKAGLEEAAGCPVLLNSGASGSLRKQVESGAGVDLFISADPSDLDALAAAGLIVPGTRRTLATNRLWLVAARDFAAPPPGSEIRDPRDLLPLLGAARRLSTGNPATVPLGRYARAALEASGLGAAAAPKLVLAGNARQALEFVLRGSAELGLVFASDAGPHVATGELVLVFAFPAGGSYPVPVYEAAAIRASARLSSAAAAEAFLVGPVAQALLQARGFLPP